MSYYPGLQDDPAQRIVLMSSTGIGPTSLLHLPDGTAAFPIKTGVNPSDGLTTNVFIVPLVHRQAAIAAGLIEMPNSIAQGQSIELATRTGSLGDWFYAQDFGMIAYYLIASSKYNVSRDGWYFGDLGHNEWTASAEYLASLGSATTTS